MALIGGRLVQYAGAMVLWGSPLFFLYGAPGEPPLSHLRRDSWQPRMLQAAAVTVLIGAIAWALAETASMSDQPTGSIGPAALWTVLSQTRFGLACLVRMVLVVLALAIALAVRGEKRMWTLEAIVGCAISVSFAWTGHGASDIGRTAGIQLGADLLHLLAAGAWIGALVPLSILGFRASRSSRSEDARTLLLALHAFSSIGMWVVAVLVSSGIVNSLSLFDLHDWRMSLTTLYARVLLVKFALFFAMLGLATFNRYRATPGLDFALEKDIPPGQALRSARSSVLSETLLAILVLLVVSWLGTLAPPISYSRQ